MSVSVPTTLRAGEPVLQFLRANYRANQPAILEGRHGVGKSALVADAAKSLGIGCAVFDLSLMEPTDLTGLPYHDDSGRTRYAPPIGLPSTGKGLLVFEELNRAPESTRTPCLQLCTARRLNDYKLPPGWVPMAAVNPSGGGYHVDRLDPALASRFNWAVVEADRVRWIEWAERSGVDSRVVGFIGANPSIFDGDSSNPRSWEYVSNIVKAWEADEDGELLPLVSGLVGVELALDFLRHYRGREKTLSGSQVVADYKAHRNLIKDQVEDGRLDAVGITVQKLKEHLATDRVKRNGAESKNIALFLGDLPADLKIELRSWLTRNGNLPRSKGSCV